MAGLLATDAWRQFRCNWLTYTPFFFDGQEVRTVTVDGVVQFMGSEVCKRLGYANSSKAMADHCRGITDRYPLMTAAGVCRCFARWIGRDALRLIQGDRKTIPPF